MDTSETFDRPLVIDPAQWPEDLLPQAFEVQKLAAEERRQVNTRLRPVTQRALDQIAARVDTGPAVWREQALSVFGLLCHAIRQQHEEAPTPAQVLGWILDGLRMAETIPDGMAAELRRTAILGMHNPQVTADEAAKTFATAEVLGPQE